MTDEAEQEDVTDEAAQEELLRFQTWVANHPVEKVRIRDRWTIILFVIFAVLGLIAWSRATYSGQFYLIFIGSSTVTGLCILETCALLATGVLSIGYTCEAFREAGVHGAYGGTGTGKALMTVGMFSILSLIFILVAIVFHYLYCRSEHRTTWLYLAYLAATAMVFVIFTILDLIAMKKGRFYKICRSYWALGLFCDGPAALAFLLLIVYVVVFYSRSNAELPSFDVIGGAVAMQIMIADVIYLGVATNFFFYLYKNHACHGIVALEGVSPKPKPKT